MAMNPPTPGLRRIHHDSRSFNKVTLSVPPGAVLDVSDEIADQLTAASPQFKDTPAPAKPQAKKTAAKKTAAKKG